MTDNQEIETYSDMFTAYLAGLGDVPAHATPLVFHARRICAQLDRQTTENAETISAKDSSYLRAIEALHVRLNPKKRGAGDAAGPPPVPGQVSIFDALDDD